MATPLAKDWMKGLLALAALLLATNLPAADLPPRDPPTLAEIAYGPHARNVLDFWQADGDGPRPLLVYIHGGGWTGGDKFQEGNPQRTWLCCWPLPPACVVNHCRRGFLPLVKLVWPVR